MNELFSKILSIINVQNLVEWALASGLRILLIVIFAYILLKILKLFITRIEKAAIKDKGDSISSAELEKRVLTIGNLLRKIAFVTVLIISLMMILKEIGIDIAPIIAGAGIIGLAVGFGAQNLVKDIISGFFILLENQLSVGDYAVINGIWGTVEDINLRTILMRDVEGSVHVVSNGSISTLANMNKGWSRFVMDLGIAYKEDINWVMEVLKDIGEEMSADEYFGGLIMEPLNVLGVNDFGGSEVVIKCMLKTQPLRQWEVGREFRKRVKLKFDELNIEIPYPHMSIYFGEASNPFTHRVELKEKANSAIKGNG